MKNVYRNQIVSSAACSFRFREWQRVGFAAALIVMMSLPAWVEATDFEIREHLGHSWKNECVTFSLTPAQLEKARKGLALVGAEGKEVAWQLVKGKDEADTRICFQVDLPPGESRAFQFSDKRASAKSDLKIEETGDELRVVNRFTGLAVRKVLKDGQAPIAGIRLKTGTWTGDSSLADTPAIKSYKVEVAARGPVFVEIVCHVEFADGGEWNLRFRVEQNEPVVLVRESFDAPGRGTFRVVLGGESFQPKNVFFRAGAPPTFGAVRSAGIPTQGSAFQLEPWLHWWQAEKRGNWFALFTPEAPVIDTSPKVGDADADEVDKLLEDVVPKPVEKFPDMLAVGLLRPSLWKDPKWRGKAPHVPIHISAVAENGVVTVPFPLGGGKRFWMLAALGKTQSVSVLSQNNRNVAPPPHQYLIKHGDFPLDEVKDYVLDWKGDHENYPRLYIGKEDVAKLRSSLKSNPRELQRWESQQPINKYNIGGPLHEYYASGSKRLDKNIVERCDEWLRFVTHHDVLLQNSRVTLGVAPHMQAVMLLPTLNLVDAALGCESLTPELRRRFLAQIAFLGYAVNRDDYWSPQRGFSANPNMTTTVAQYQVALASLLPSHPMAKQWAARGLGQLRYQLNAWSDADGGWLEAPHYAMVSYDHMFGAFVMAARAGFSDFLYEDRMRKVMGWFAKISTPRDPRTGGFRHFPPIGNTYHGEPTGMFGIVAGLWKNRDPEFAANMQWMCEEHGSPDIGIGWSFPTMAGYKGLLKAHGVAPRKPNYGSAWFRNTGVVLRNEMGSERETYLHLIAGGNHAHYDYDSGSVILWGKGRVLADDWGYIGRHGAHYHNMLNAPGAGGNMYIEEFSTKPALDYVSGRKGTWQRQIAFSKDADPLGPNYFLIRDSNQADIPATWRLWLSVEPDAYKFGDKNAGKNLPKIPQEGLNIDDNPADELDDIDLQVAADSKPKSKPAAPPSPIRIHQQGVSVTGADDVDLDIFFYDAANLNLKTEKASQKMSCGNRYGRVGPMQLTQTALIASLKGRGAIIALLYPRLKKEPPPKVIWHAGGRIAEVISQAGTDFIFLSPKPSADSKQEEFKTADGKTGFRGTAASVQIRGKTVKKTLGSPGEIRLGKKTFK